MADSATLAVILAQTTKEPSPTFDVPTMYRRCGCMGKMIGRACGKCLDRAWLKTCLDCYGLGTLSKAARLGGQERTERCGRCMGAGWTPMAMVDLAAALAEEKALTEAAAIDHSQDIEAVDPAAVVRKSKKI
jgi:hypothetical protein